MRGDIGGGGDVVGIFQDVVWEAMFLLLQAGEDLLGEFGAGFRERSFAGGQGHAGQGFLIADGETGRIDGALAGARQLRGVLAGFGVLVLIDGGEAAEEKIADVGEDGSAAGRDASAGKKPVEGGEGIVDALGVEEVVGAVSEGGFEVLVVAGLGGGVAGTVGGFGIDDVGGALASGAGAVLAAFVSESVEVAFMLVPRHSWILSACVHASCFCNVDRKC